VSEGGEVKSKELIQGSGLTRRCLGNEKGLCGIIVGKARGYAGSLCITKVLASRQEKGAGPGECTIAIVRAKGGDKKNGRTMEGKPRQDSGDEKSGKPA